MSHTYSLGAVRRDHQRLGKVVHYPDELHILLHCRADGNLLLRCIDINPQALTILGEV